MENSDLGKIIDNQFIDYILAREGFKYLKLKDEVRLNQNRIHYDKKTNRLLLLNLVVVTDQIRIFLWAVDLEFIVEEKKPDQPIEKFAEDLKAKYFQKVQIILTDSNNKKIDHTPADDPSIIPQTFIVNNNGDLIALYSQKRIFICKFKLDKTNPPKELKAQELTLDEGTLELDAIKWHPESPVHLGLLSNNRFLIYDVAESLEDPEFSLGLSPKKKSRNIIAFPGEDVKHEDSLMIDFNFCTQDRLEDFRFLSVFFMNVYGELYYYAPIILGKIAIDEMELLDLKKRTQEKWAGSDDASDVDRYYGRLFDCLENSSTIQEDKKVLKSIVNTEYEILNNKNSIQGPIKQRDGTTKKIPRKRKDYVAFYRFEHKRSHIFVTVRRNGKVTFLFSLSSCAPNPKPSAPVWDNETPFQFAVISKFQLPNFLPEFRASFQSSQTKNLDMYNQIRNNIGIQFLDCETYKTKLLLAYYNRIYLFHLEWADLVENCLETKTSVDHLPRRDDFRTDLEVIVDKPAEMISTDLPDAKQLNLFSYGYLGITMIHGNLFLINTDGTYCDYSFIRTAVGNRDKKAPDTKTSELPVFGKMDEELKSLMKKARELEQKQETFSMLATKITQIPHVGKKDDFTEEELKAVENHFNETSQLKEAIENDFTERIDFLVQLCNKQNTMLKNIQERVKDLKEKKEDFHGKVFDRMTAMNKKLKEKIKRIMENLKNIITPLSDEDIKCKQVLEDLVPKLKSTKENLANIRQRCQQIQEARKEMASKEYYIQDPSVFGDFNKEFIELKSEISNLNEDLNELDVELEGKQKNNKPKEHSGR